ncbi:MAG: hypothetical protein OK441_02270 [Thaumarchaeota archaeon]|nr:hypothetical protein [Nitrososphaerota archaeon]
MPVCPKCHELISEEHWERHLSRCGVHHKHGPMPLFSTSGGTMGATPYDPDLIPPIAYPWWKYGLQVWPPRRLTTKQKGYLAIYYFLVFGGAVTIFWVVWGMLGALL